MITPIELVRIATKCLLFVLLMPHANIKAADKHNVLFIIADDLTATALSCYGNQVCHTPNIDRLAAKGMRFTRAYCQGAYCGPSRASLLSGYYPHATGVQGYNSPRAATGERATWPQHFKDAGYYSARVSKIFHMGVPTDIETGSNGADDSASWSERFNSAGPEWKAAGKGETLEGNPDGRKSVMGGNTFVVVAADGDDLVHADGKTAEKACELIAEHKSGPFFLAVGFVRPHVPFASPAKYHTAYDWEAMQLPEKVANDWDDRSTRETRCSIYECSLCGAGLPGFTHGGAFRQLSEHHRRAEQLGCRAGKIATEGATIASATCVGWIHNAGNRQNLPWSGHSVLS